MRCACCTYRLELLVSGLVAMVLVGMVDDSQLPISLFDFKLGRIRLDTERIVVFRFFDHGSEGGVLNERGGRREQATRGGEVVDSGGGGCVFSSRENPFVCSSCLRRSVLTMVRGDEE